jgi:hypothetical protein
MEDYRDDLINNKQLLYRIFQAIFTLVAIISQGNDTVFERATQAVVDLCHSVIGIVNNQLPADTVHIKADPLCDGTIRLHAPHVRISNFVDKFLLNAI